MDIFISVVNGILFFYSVDLHVYILNAVERKKKHDNDDEMFYSECCVKEILVSG